MTVEQFWTEIAKFEAGEVMAWGNHHPNLTSARDAERMKAYVRLFHLEVGIL